MLDCHTLYSPNMTNATSDAAIWYWDGVSYPNGPSLVGAMKASAFNERTMILLLMPDNKGRGDNFSKVSLESTIDTFLRHLAQDVHVKFKFIGAGKGRGWGGREREDWLFPRT